MNSLLTERAAQEACRQLGASRARLLQMMQPGQSGAGGSSQAGSSFPRSRLMRGLVGSKGVGLVVLMLLELYANARPTSRWRRYLSMGGIVARALQG